MIALLIGVLAGRRWRRRGDARRRRSADVQRRLSAIGVKRAVGFPRGGDVGALRARAPLVALPAAALGLAVGALSPAARPATCSSSLSEMPPGAALMRPLLGRARGRSLALVAAATAWPAWRAAASRRRPLLRGAELPQGARRSRAPGGPLRALALGSRRRAPRRGRGRRRARVGVARRRRAADARARLAPRSACATTPARSASATS